jgi:predicted cupin superfamily sugar epimerase
MKTADYWIKNLNLKPHPEGGYYREPYDSQEKIPKKFLPERYKGDRSFCNAIYYLLEKNDFSSFHRIQSDEIWHHYEGSSLLIHVIHPQGKYEILKLGKTLENGEEPQIVVPWGVWFGAELVDKSSLALVGCTVAPGFDFQDFEMGKRTDLLKQFPQHKEIISQLTRD